MPFTLNARRQTLASNVASKDKRALANLILNRENKPSRGVLH